MVKEAIQRVHDLLCNNDYVVTTTMKELDLPYIRLDIPGITNDNCKDKKGNEISVVIHLFIDAIGASQGLDEMQKLNNILNTKHISNKYCSFYKVEDMQLQEETHIVLNLKIDIKER